ncbi:MAG TPA: CHAD domain-containing protein, partial [Variovorax sp.]|nr:CHAD domain-containing protein [Variovorax sp.]
PEPAEPEPAPAAVVRDQAFQLVLMSLIAASLPPAEPAPDVPLPEQQKAKPARKPLRARLAKLHRQVVREGRHFEALEPAVQHRVRKRLKRLRYLAEFVAPIFGVGRAERYLKELKPAQDALGEHNDAAVAIDAYREAASRDGSAWFAVGWLSARQPQSARECRAALEKIAQARRFWKSS